MPACALAHTAGHTQAKAASGSALSNRGTRAASRVRVCDTRQRGPLRCLALGLCAAVARVNLHRRHFPLAAACTVGHTHANALPAAAAQGVDSGSPTPGRGSPVPRQGPSGYSSAPFCCLIRLSAAERMGCLVELGRLLQGRGAG